MAKILMHPKNKNQKGSKVHVELYESHQKYKSAYQLTFVLLMSSCLINLVLMTALAHYIMVK